MTAEEKLTYWDPAARSIFWKVRGTEAANQALGKTLGLSDYKDWVHRDPEEDFPMSDDLKGLLTLLAGPHGLSILKAYRIKKGLKK
jgi:hypothetical protein